MPNFIGSFGPHTCEGTFDFRTGSLLIPSGSILSAGQGAQVVFVTSSGILAVHNGTSWLIASGTIEGDGLPAVFDDIVLWMDMGAGTNSGTAPVSVVVNPSGATTGSFGSTPPTYAMVSGNNSWVFADNSASQIHGADRFNFDDDNPWVKTIGFVIKAGAIGATTRSIGGWKVGPTSNPGLDVQTQAGAFGIRYGSSSAASTYALDDKDNSCLALFAVISGSKSGLSSFGSGCLYVGSNTFEQNFGSLENVAPAVMSGAMGDMGTVNSCAMSIISWMVWNRAITAAERADIKTYYSGRGIEVL